MADWKESTVDQSSEGRMAVTWEDAGLNRVRLRIAAGDGAVSIIMAPEHLAQLGAGLLTAMEPRRAYRRRLLRQADSQSGVWRL
jgi:hypothetical protein